MGKCVIGGRERGKISCGEDDRFGISEYELYVFSTFF